MTKQVISLFALVMINVIAIDSLRNVPAAAEYGLSLITYYLIAAIGFFIPSAMVSAELATGWPKDGGIYVWIREAFGHRWGLLAIWLQWIENVIWYPTIMSFIAATFLYMLNPQLVEDKFLLLSLMLIFFWAATYLNLRGMQISALLSELCAVFGTLLPMLVIIFLGIIWLLLGYPAHIQFSLSALIPDFSNIQNLTYLTGILLSLVGTELSASYAQSIQHPQKNYPKAMLFSVIIILGSLIFSSLAISIVLSKQEISLVNGLVEAFDAFFKAYHLTWFTPIIATVIIIGGFGNVAAWILGPSKGLLAASEDGNIPAIFKKLNAKGAPASLLIFQAIIFSGLCSIFLFMPSINSSYWILTALATQLYMLMYLLMFIAVIRLRYTHQHVHRSYKIPGKSIGVWLIAGLGGISSILAILIGFLPPVDFKYGNLFFYEIILLIGLVLLTTPPFIYSYIRHKDKSLPTVLEQVR